MSRTTQIDPIPAALDAMADYFGGAIDDPEVLTVVRGWPERNKAVELVAEGAGRGSVLAVLSAEAPIELLPPIIVCKNARADGAWDVGYRIGYLTIAGTLDLWCTHRAVRDDMGGRLRSTFHNRLPRTSDLEIDAARYHDRPLKIAFAGGRLVDDEASVTRGEWRQIWDFSLVSDIIVFIRQAKLTSIIIKTTVTDSGIAILETPDLTVP